MQTVTIKQTSWALDKSHSEIGFKVKHLMVSNTKGIFSEYDGTITTEGDDFSTATIDLTIQAASINTRDAQRDAHLKNADFFDVEQFPELHFKSEHLEKLGDSEYTLYGQFTIKGITLPIKLNVEYAGIVNDPWGGKRSGFVIDGKINRKDWGLTWSPVMETGGLVVGENISLHCEIELLAQA